MSALMRHWWCLLLFLGAGLAFTQAPASRLAQKASSSAPGGDAPLVPPMLLQKRALESGNPLATYTAMLDLEQRYRAFKPLAGIYDEVRFNFEEFLGFPMAGVQAMALPIYRTNPGKEGTF